MRPIPSTRAVGAGVTFRVMMQLGDESELPNVGIYDTSRYDEAAYGVLGDAYMVDVTEYALGFTTTNGRQAYTSRFRAGLATITLDNTAGEWTPTGGNQLPGFLPLRPGRIVQIFAEYGTTTAQIYEGFIDTIGDRYGDDGSLTTRVACYDLLGLAPLNNTVAQPSAGSGESSWARIRRILAHFFEPVPAMRTHGNGPAATMQATTLAQSALHELQITADSEGGGVWMGPAGTLQLALFDYFASAADGPPRWTAGTAQVGIVALPLTDWSAQRVVNEAHIANAGGDEQIAENLTSRAKFQRRTHTRLDLQALDDSQAAKIAQRFVTNLANDRAELPGLTLQPGTDAEYQFGAVAAIGDTVLVHVATLPGWSYTVKTQIFGIAHSVNAETWRVSFLLDDTEIEAIGAFASGFDAGFDV